MALTKQDIIEIQEAARYNYEKQVQRQNEQAELKKRVEERVKADRAKREAATTSKKSTKKGK